MESRKGNPFSTTNGTKYTNNRERGLGGGVPGGVGGYAGCDIALAYRFASDDNGSGVPIGLLKERSAIVFNTSNTATSREIEVFKDPLETLWKNCILGFCGISDVYRKTFSIVCISSSETVTLWLDEVRERVMVHFSFSSPHVEKLENTTDIGG